MKGRCSIVACISLIVGLVHGTGVVDAQERPYGELRRLAPMHYGPSTFFEYPRLGSPLAPGLMVWSPDAEVRERQAIARQLSVIDYVRWHSHSLVPGPWLGPPVHDPAFIWGFPHIDVVAQPVGHRRIYDGRGGYSSFPVYADDLPQVPSPPLRTPPVGCAPFNGALEPPPNGLVEPPIDSARREPRPPDAARREPRPPSSPRGYSW
jgi:hypothetical protein